jgi:hypothetical protein
MSTDDTSQHIWINLLETNDALGDSAHLLNLHNF